MKALAPASYSSSVSWDRDLSELPYSCLSPVSFKGEGKEYSNTLPYCGSAGKSEVNPKQSLLVLTPKYVLLGCPCILVSDSTGELIHAKHNVMIGALCFLLRE